MQANFFYLMKKLTWENLLQKYINYKNTFVILIRLINLGFINFKKSAIIYYLKQSKVEKEWSVTIFIKKFNNNNKNELPTEICRNISIYFI